MRYARQTTVFFAARVRVRGRKILADEDITLTALRGLLQLLSEKGVQITSSGDVVITAPNITLTGTVNIEGDLNISGTETGGGPA